MKNLRYAILLVIFSLVSLQSSASHIVGGEFTYQHVGDSSAGGTLYRKYSLTLVIYEDCLTGQPEAIAEDNPAFFGIYEGNGALYLIDTSVFYSSSIGVPNNFSNSCITNIPSTCLIKKTFTRTYALKINTSGYVISYQRCCRNSTIMNVIDPGDQGSTYYCQIPGIMINNSAVFTNFPPQIICINNPLVYDNSATDADGDSLSYEFCTALVCAEVTNTNKPIPLPPPYDSVDYIAPFSAQNPITGSPQIEIDPHTGKITGTPTHLGRFLVTVCCHEWRDGVMINTVKREFQFVVTDCSKTVVADIPQYSTDSNTYIINCKDYTVNFVNNSKGGFSYLWNFGVQGTTNDTSTAFEPTFTFPDTGTYAVKLVVNPGTTCSDSITRLVKLYPIFKSGFIDSGMYCPGLPILFSDKTVATFMPITKWKWFFGDGDSASEQNPLHAYTYGGTYNALLISQNIKHCTDTALRAVIVQNFKPFVGDDTIIVKGESIQFQGTGGVIYSWTPSTNLNATDVSDPIGYYPDTGTFVYYVHVKSAFGCTGDDTVKVWVVDHASFVMPTAFSPNGDGHNDYFRPISVGYRALKYFRVFDRWGEEVWYSTNLETGWDGNYKGKPCQLGTYFWEISFIDRFGKSAFMKGDVTLLR